jgi:hypothetical protein
MQPSNIYDQGCKQFNPKKMSERQQTKYLLDKTKIVGYDPETDVALAGKTRGSACDIDYQEEFDKQKRRAVFILP